MTYTKQLLIMISFTFVACVSDREKNVQDHAAKQSLNESWCASYEDDSCCDDAPDSCANNYGQRFASYLGFSAFSNGNCTNGAYGLYQCVAFVKDFYSDRLKFVLGSLGDAGKFMDGISNKSYLNKEIFAFRANVQEFPRETDILIFSKEYRDCTKKVTGDCVEFGEWKTSYGHVVLVSGIDSSGLIRIIEQNVVPMDCSQDDTSSYGRKLKVDPDTKNVYAFNMKNTDVLKWEYLGIIRHNLAGIYGDVGWHTDGVSDAFHAAYMKYSGKLGWAFDNGGGPFVHMIRNVPVQDFVSTNPDNHFGTDGKTMLLYSSWNGINRASLLKEGFKCVYQTLKNVQGDSMGGIELLGVPIDNEHDAYIVIDSNGNDSCIESDPMDPNATHVQSFQPFERGCMWYKDDVDRTVHVHANDGTKISDADLSSLASTCSVSVENNPPGPKCTNDCSPGAQQCNGSSQVKICGHPGTDSCYHWLTLSCGSGTSCVNNACVTNSNSSVSAATVSSTGGASSIRGVCTWHSQRCGSNSLSYQLCMLDQYSNQTYWMDVPCSSGWSCTASDGACHTVIVASVTGGASSMNLSSGGSSVGGSSSLGGSVSVGGMSAIGSTGGTSSASTSSQSGSSSAKGGSATTGGSTSSGSSPTNDALLFHYNGPVIGSYVLNAWWQNPDGTTRAWGPITECADTESYDRVLQCALPILPGSRLFEFQVNIPDGRYWGDESCDATGGCGAPIGTVTITKGDMTVGYSMTPNPSGAPYYNGFLSILP